MDKAADALKMMSAQSAPDIICLAETDLETSSELWKVLPGTFELRQSAYTGKPSRLHRISMFYNSARVRFLKDVPETDTIGGEGQNLAIRHEFQLTDGHLLHVYALHWVSRVRAPEDTAIRGDIAQKLRMRIDNSLREKASPQVIVMGDFNDNPYDRSVTKYLRATRDIHMARKKPELLYNPFWRSLVSECGYSIGSSLKPSSGSYFHGRGNDSHQWHVFDQILGSHGLLGSSGWHLNEMQTGVLDQFDLHGISLEPNAGFDHYPVVALFEKDAQK